MGDTITLICLLGDEPFRKSFSIDIDNANTISHLKNVVKRERQSALGVDARISTSTAFRSRAGHRGTETIYWPYSPTERGADLRKKAGEVFPFPAPEHTHVIIKIPGTGRQR